MSKGKPSQNSIFILYDAITMDCNKIIDLLAYDYPHSKALENARGILFEIGLYENPNTTKVLYYGKRLSNLGYNGSWNSDRDGDESIYCFLNTEYTWIMNFQEPPTSDDDIWVQEVYSKAMKNLKDPDNLAKGLGEWSHNMCFIVSQVLNKDDSKETKNILAKGFLKHFD